MNEELDHDILEFGLETKHRIRKVIIESDGNS